MGSEAKDMFVKGIKDGWLFPRNLILKVLTGEI